MTRTFVAVFLVLFGGCSEAQVLEQTHKKVMDGFPPKPDTQVTFANYRTYPYSKWSFNNIGAVLNTRVIPRGESQWQFEDSKQALTDAQHDLVSRTFSANDADAVIITQDGRLLHEEYWNHSTQHKPHIWFSMTKSLTSAVFGLLVEQGKVKLEDSPAKYIPELKNSGFERVTIQNVLNHSSAIDFKENYTDSNSLFLKKYAPALNMSYITGSRDDNPLTSEAYGVYDFISRFVKPDLSVLPGSVFDYNSSNADVLGWLIARISGVELDEFIHHAVWQHLSPDHDAFIVVDRAYMPVATAGMNSTLRDAAKFAHMVMQNGVFNGKQVIPESWVKNITNISDKQRKKMKANPIYRNSSWEAYNNMWWIIDANRGEFAAVGIHGQTIYINQSKKVAAVFFSSHKIASNAKSEKFSTKLAALREVVNQL